MFLPLVDISLGWISHSIYISLYKCCIYKIDTRLILADCDLQQQQHQVLITVSNVSLALTLNLLTPFTHLLAYLVKWNVVILSFEAKNFQV